MDVMAAKPGAPRRRHSAHLKAEVVSECQKPGASVAAIALARGLNANLVHGWLRLSKAAQKQNDSVERAVDERFVELQLTAKGPNSSAFFGMCVSARRKDSTHQSPHQKI